MTTYYLNKASHIDEFFLKAFTQVVNELDQQPSYQAILAECDRLVLLQIAEIETRDNYLAASRNHIEASTALLKESDNKAKSLRNELEAGLKADGERSPLPERLRRETAYLFKLNQSIKAHHTAARFANKMALEATNKVKALGEQYEATISQLPEHIRSALEVVDELIPSVSPCIQEVFTKAAH